ncbi:MULTISPECIES: hypothetical protein [unclassified Mucilaginibacter]|uniref:hypothetical protein n=1 Tax=unclassified Mucilaginibacter TaxID=2617802 RepID=UPI00138DBADC|nr:MULTISPECIES: hypothetical protein [unclassified Mucilaginibacter]MBB5395689.1 hypothetical protein [Mucilaginibacter sp. AK015]QHS56011.1 hypothetical protein GWR56_10870 [Mucilaginibacter sp. 14171R-50]
MRHKIKLPDGTLQLIDITSAYFKTWHVWNVKFADGKVAMLFKIGSEWMQRNEDFLDEHVVNAIGKRIDSILLRRKIAF